MHAFALSIALLIGQTDKVAPGDVWPQWRGPTADSVAVTKGLPLKWSKTENIAWKTPLPGWGTSTPAIWGDTIFVTTQDEERLLLLRIETSTGKIQWEREVGRGVPRRKAPLGNLRFHDEHNMASPSPTTDGKHVWVHFGNGDLACYNFAGDKIWDANFAKSYGVLSIWWGRANSPVIVGDLLISVCMQDPLLKGQSYVVAHEKLTGKQKWFTERVTGATGEPADAYTTPLVFDNKGSTEIIVFGGNVLDAYDPATGKKLWQAKPFTGNRVISGPTLIGDTVYAVQGMKGPLFSVKAGGNGDVTKTNVNWKYTGTTPDAACPVFANGLVFLATNPGIALCIDAKDGKEVWKERLADAFRSTPLVAGNHIYFFAKDGKATIVEADRTLKTVGQGDLGEDLMASPAAAHGCLFIRTKGHLFRIRSQMK